MLYQNYLDLLPPRIRSHHTEQGERFFTIPFILRKLWTAMTVFFVKQTLANRNDILQVLFNFPTGPRARSCCGALISDRSGHFLLKVHCHEKSESN
jgi:hypothetical protein